MTDAQLWSLIIGALLPNVIAVVNQPRWSTTLRTITMVFICSIAGVITVLLNGGIGGKSLVSSILIMIVAAVTFYREVWSRLGVTQAIENATSPGTPATT
jgi:hypothetical protein